MSKCRSLASSTAATRANTKAKPEIWNEMDKFQRRKAGKTRRRDQARRSRQDRQLDTIKSLGDTAKTCKTCHDNYRKD